MKTHANQAEYGNESTNYRHYGRMQTKIDMVTILGTQYVLWIHSNYTSINNLCGHQNPFKDFVRIAY